MSPTYARDTAEQTARTRESRPQSPAPPAEAQADTPPRGPAPARATPAPGPLPLDGVLADAVEQRVSRAGAQPLLQRSLSVPAGLGFVTLGPGDAARAARGDIAAGPMSYGALKAQLRGDEVTRLDRWITDGVVRVFPAKNQAVKALQCNVEIDAVAGIDWVAGLEVKLRGETFNADRGGVVHDLSALAQLRLKNLLAGPAPAPGRAPTARFASWAALTAELRRWSEAQIDALVTGGVRADDLDVALAMYRRLDGATDEAILHKLEFRKAHSAQYHARGVDEGATSNAGLVYGPWRAPGTNVPTAGPQQVAGSGNVHTMPLNVAWLLACCHHGVTFRLYSPLTHRAMIRKQGTLSALGRELVALVRSGYYEVTGPQTQAVTWPAVTKFTGRRGNLPVASAALARFADTYVLTPTDAAKDATVDRLTVDRDTSWDTAKRELEDHGLMVEANADLDSLVDDLNKADSTFRELLVDRDAWLVKARDAVDRGVYDEALRTAQLQHRRAASLATAWGFAAPGAFIAPAFNALVII